MQCLSYYGLELEVYLPLEPQRETCLYITARLLARFLFLVCIVLKLGLHIWNDGILPLCLLFFFCSVCEYAKQKCAYTQLAPSIFYISGFIVQYVKKNLHIRDAASWETCAVFLPLQLARVFIVTWLLLLLSYFSNLLRTPVDNKIKDRNLMQRNGRMGTVQVPMRPKDFHLGLESK